MQIKQYEKPTSEIRFRGSISNLEQKWIVQNGAIKIIDKSKEDPRIKIIYSKHEFLILDTEDASELFSNKDSLYPFFNPNLEFVVPVKYEWRQVLVA